jgi:hypothetical protein
MRVSSMTTMKQMILCACVLALSACSNLTNVDRSKIKDDLYMPTPLAGKGGSGSAGRASGGTGASGTGGATQDDGDAGEADAG